MAKLRETTNVNLNDFLKKQAFEHRCVLTLENGALKSRALTRFASTAPCVYLWIADDGTTVLYTGKAGAGIEKRLREHAGGYAQAAPTHRRKAAITGYFAEREGRQINVWVRQSADVTVFGQTVTQNAAEEHALYNIFQPPWNFAVFRPAEAAAPGLADEVELDDIPGQADAQSFLSSLPEALSAKFRDLLGALRSLGILDLDCRLIEGYANQPRGLNDTQTLTFGRFRNRRFAPNSWCARIPMVPEVTVVFPSDILRTSARSGAVEYGPDRRSWRPANLDAFLADPDEFIDRGALASRLQATPGINA